VETKVEVCELNRVTVDSTVGGKTLVQLLAGQD